MPARRSNAENLARSVKLLMAAQQVRQQHLGQKIERSQSTISNLLKGEAGISNPTLETIELVADHFKVPVWSLFVPGITPELMKSAELAQLLERYASLDARSRAMILNVAEGQAALNRAEEGQEFAKAS